MKSERITEKTKISSTKTVDFEELREQCLTLKESKQDLLYMVHKHFHQ